MAERAHQYRLSNNSFRNNAVDRKIAPHELRRSAQRGIDRNEHVSLLFPGDHNEPDRSGYIAPLRERRASLSSRILAGVCAAAALAVLFALFSSDATRDFVNVTASMAGIGPAPAATASGPVPLASPAGDHVRFSTSADGTWGAPNLTIANVSPTREEIKNAYQSAMRGRAPVVAMVEQPAPIVDAVHRLDPREVTASLKRGDALIASGDIAAARLVLRHAADDGNAQAAIALGGTYDPTVLEKLDVRGPVPDVLTARDWYEKAKKFGAPEAAQRLEALSSKHR